MEHENKIRDLTYEKPIAEVIIFDNSDIITASGNGGAGGGCLTWSNKTGASCHYGLTVVF